VVVSSTVIVSESLSCVFKIYQASRLMRKMV